MEWKNKTIFITGAGGFIGSHLTEALLDRNAEVKAFVRYNSRNDWGLLELLPPEKLARIEVISGDMRDADAVRHATTDVDMIFHLGSLIAIPYSYLHPRETIETNIMATLNMLTAAKENNVERFIHTSTSEVYGTARYVPIDERHPLQGQSPYSASKIGADKVAESFYCAFGVPVTTVRPFNTYGPRQSSRAVIPTIITQALTQETIHLGSLHPTRDFTFVRDLVEGFIGAATSEKMIGEVINIGSNYEISIGDLAQKIIELTGRDVEITSDSSRLRPEKSEVERLWCDNTRAKELLGWSPTVSLDEGLAITIAWIKGHLDRFKPNQYTR
jgi:dTDP-glucose 4,6-dehydratase